MFTTNTSCGNNFAAELSRGLLFFQKALTDFFCFWQCYYITISKINSENKQYNAAVANSNNSCTYILCLSLFLGRPIGFAYRRLIWSAFLCSSFFPFSFGLHTWQIQVPGGYPNTERSIWAGSSIRGTYSTFISNIFFDSGHWRESHPLTMTINYSAQSRNPLEKHWVNFISREIDFLSACLAELCDFYELPSNWLAKERVPSLQASLWGQHCNPEIANLPGDAEIIWCACKAPNKPPLPLCVLSDSPIRPSVKKRLWHDSREGNRGARQCKQLTFWHSWKRRVAALHVKAPITWIAEEHLILKGSGRHVWEVSLLHTCNSPCHLKSFGKISPVVHKRGFYKSSGRHKMRSTAEPTTRGMVRVEMHCTYSVFPLYSTGAAGFAFNTLPS